MAVPQEGGRERMPGCDSRPASCLPFLQWKRQDLSQGHGVIAESPFSAGDVPLTSMGMGRSLSHAPAIRGPRGTRLRTLKCKVGADWEEECCSSVRNVVGHDFTLRVDANGSVRQGGHGFCVRLEALASLEVHSIRTTLHPEVPRWQRHLRENVLPCADESDRRAYLDGTQRTVRPQQVLALLVGGLDSATVWSRLANNAAWAGGPHPRPTWPANHCPMGGKYGLP